MSKTSLDLNQESFQRDLLALETEEVLAVLSTLRKIRQLSWPELYRDTGSRWEAIQSSVGPDGERLYSIRITRRIRATCYRTGDLLRFLSLHPDHDSAYKK